MADESLKVISIDELVPGMYVQEIVEQTGQLKVKSKGRVTKKAIVAGLRAKGVRKVMIDPSKAFTPESEEAPEAVADIIEPAQQEEHQTASLEDELTRAKKLHAQGKNIQKQLLKAVQKGLPFDNTVPREFAHNLVESIDRNPDALLCLTKIREKDDYLLEHSLNVAILLANFGRFLGLGDQDVEDLAYSGFLHDIGKIQIPDEILHKPGRLTDDEMDIMKKHVEYGVDFLKEMEIAPKFIRTVSEHHERLDGLGYPNRVSGKDISKSGKMLAVVDMYDALTADRVYKAGMPSQKAFAILMADTPERLEKELVQQFIKCMGIYPVGSLVLLNNERLAMVIEQTDSPLAPLVRIFYSVRNSHFLEPRDVDLSGDTSLRVVKAVLGSDYRIDVNAFFNRAVAI